MILHLQRSSYYYNVYGDVKWESVKQIWDAEFNLNLYEKFCLIYIFEFQFKLCRVMLLYIVINSILCTKIIAIYFLNKYLFRSAWHNINLSVKPIACFMFILSAFVFQLMFVCKLVMQVITNILMCWSRTTLGNQSDWLLISIFEVTLK